MFVLQNSVPRRIFGLRRGKNTTAMKPLLSFLTLTQTFRATGFTSPKDKRKSQTWMHFCRPIFTWVFMHVFNTVSVYICACLYNRGASDITRASPRIVECLFYLILSLLHLITYLCPFLLLSSFSSWHITPSLCECVSLSPHFSSSLTSLARETTCCQESSLLSVRPRWEGIFEKHISSGVILRSSREERETGFGDRSGGSRTVHPTLI